MRIDMLQIYKDRLEQIEKDIKKMARSKNFINYGVLKSERIKLIEIIKRLEEKNEK